MSVLVNEIAFAAASGIGAVFHYAKKYAKKETQAALHEWFGSANLPATIAALGTLVMTVGGVLASGAIDTQTLGAVIYAGLTTGFAIDSAANSDGT